MQAESQGSEARDFHYSDRPTAFDLLTAVSRDFVEFLVPLHKEFTPRQQALTAKRATVPAEAHRGRLPNHLAGDNGNPVVLTPYELVNRLFDEQLDSLLNELPPQSEQSEIEKYRQVRLISEEMIVHHRFDPS